MILVTHMAGLTKPYEIFTNICGLRAFKKPKRFFVVNWKAFADMFTAIIAVPALLLNDSSARRKPTPTAICPRAANPIGRILAFRLCIGSAIHRAKPCNAILTGQPRLLAKSFTAAFARQRQPFLPSAIGAAPHILGPKRIGRTLTGAKFITDKVGFGRGIEKCLGLPTRPAGRAAKPCFPGSVRLDEKRRFADFTGFFNHVGTIQQTKYMGKRTTLIACERVQKAYRQPDLFVEPPKPAQQEGFDL